MQDFVTFLVEHWQLLLGAFLCLCSLVVSLIKKRPSAYNLGDYVRLICAQFLPEYIKDAEATNMTGARKRELVLSKCIKSLKGFCRCSDKDLEEAYVAFADQLEEILTTPRKK